MGAQPLHWRKLIFSVSVIGAGVPQPQTLNAFPLQDPPQRVCPLSLCPLSRYCVGFGHFFLSLDIQEGKGVLFAQPIRLTFLPHPSLTYQDALAQRRVSVSLLLHWLPEDHEVSAKPPERACGDHSAVTAGVNLRPRGVEIMSPPPLGAGEQETRDTAGYLLSEVSWGLGSHDSLLRRKVLIILFLLLYSPAYVHFGMMEWVRKEKSLRVYFHGDTPAQRMLGLRQFSGRVVWRFKGIQMPELVELSFHSFHYNGPSMRERNLCLDSPTKAPGKR